MSIAAKVNKAAPNAPYFTPIQNPPSGTATVPQPSGRPIPRLFQPLKIRGLEFQNRIFLSPLCQYSAKDGFVTPWIFAHLGGILSRGPGLTFTEATGVLPQGRISPECPGIWSDAHAQAFKPIVDFAHSQNQKIGIQIAHGGRKASTVAPFLYNAPDPVATPDLGGWPDDVWGPTAQPFHTTYATPKELSKEGLKTIVQAFKDAAKRAVDVGFDVIEIHGAHGYLISSFLSPNSNKRTDEYGGESFENRIRFPLEVVDAVRSVIPENMPLFMRFSGTEWLEELDQPSWTVEDSVKLAPILAAHGVDLLDVSAGGNDPRQKIRSGPQYQVFLATAVRNALKEHNKTAENPTYVTAVGQLHGAQDAYDVVENEKADAVFIGRQFQKNPGLVWTIADELGVDIVNAQQIAWGFKGRGVKGLGTSKKEEAGKL